MQGKLLRLLPAVALLAIPAFAQAGGEHEDGFVQITNPNYDTIRIHASMNVGFNTAFPRVEFIKLEGSAPHGSPVVIRARSFDRHYGNTRDAYCVVSAYTPYGAVNPLYEVARDLLSAGGDGTLIVAEREANPIKSECTVLWIAKSSRLLHAEVMLR